MKSEWPYDMLNISNRNARIFNMAKGVIYVMTTVVPGLIKIGKTRTENYESRMYQLERNGYFNVVGLKRKFAIVASDTDLTNSPLIVLIFSLLI